MLFVLLLFCSLIYRKMMTGKIHVFPFSNDIYVMLDLLLLLLLARCQTLWYHLYARIIMLYQVKAQPVGYTFYMCSLHFFVLYIILIYALPYNGDLLCCIVGGRVYFMMFFTISLVGFFVLLLVCCHTVNKVLLHNDNVLILEKVKLQTNGN